MSDDELMSPTTNDYKAWCERSATILEVPVPTVRPMTNFDFQEDVRVIYNALREGDKEAVINVMCRRSTYQRLAIAQEYRTQYDVTLVKDLKAYVNFNLCKLFIGLSIPYHEFLARTIHNSIGDFKWTIYFLFTLPNQELKDMQLYFSTKYDQTVQEYIFDHKGEKHSEITRMLRQILRPLEAERDETEDWDMTEVSKDVALIHSLGPHYANREKVEKYKRKLDKQVVKKIFYNKNFRYIKAVSEEYQRQNDGKTLETYITQTFTRNREILTSIVSFAVNKYEYFADLLKLSMKGLGTHEGILIHVIVGRCDIDLMNIKEEFQRKNKASLRQWIKDDTSGHYKHALYALIGEERSHKN